MKKITFLAIVALVTFGAISTCNADCNNIGSGSKVFCKIGEQIAKGLSQGIRSGTSKPNDSHIIRDSDVDINQQNQNEEMFEKRNVEIEELIKAQQDDLNKFNSDVDSKKLVCENFSYYYELSTVKQIKSDFEEVKQNVKQDKTTSKRTQVYLWFSDLFYTISICEKPRSSSKHKLENIQTKWSY